MEGIILNSLDYPILTVTTFLPLAGALIIFFSGEMNLSNGLLLLLQ
jgi:hypothetical protein